MLIRAITQEEIAQNVEEQQPILQPASSVATTHSDEMPATTTTAVSSTKPLSIRIFGCILACIAGVLFGFVFIPSTYIQDHPYIYPTASKNGLHYVFAMYSGIFLSSIFYYVIYIVLKRNRPYLHIQSIFPAIISGIMWGIAQAGFLVANSILSQAISFPLITIGPSTVAVIWSIFYFKDITGQRNYLIITFGTILRIVSAILIILSKPVPR